MWAIHGMEVISSFYFKLPSSTLAQFTILPFWKKISEWGSLILWLSVLKHYREGERNEITKFPQVVTGAGIILRRLRNKIVFIRNPRKMAFSSIDFWQTELHMLSFYDKSDTLFDWIAQIMAFRTSCSCISDHVTVIVCFILTCNVFCFENVWI